MSGLFTPEFVAALAGIVASILISLVPAFDAVKSQLIAVIIVLVTAAIASIGGEKFAAARASGSTMVERASVKPSYAAPTVRNPTP